jgi:hypothetical protein
MRPEQGPMLAGRKHGMAVVVFAATLGMAKPSTADTPSEGHWLLGVESGRYAPLGVIGATVSYVTPRLSFGVGLGLGFAYEETYEQPYIPWALSGKYYLYQYGSLRLGLSASYSVEERVIAYTLHRSTRSAETIEWRTPYGGGRYNGSLFAEWRRGSFVTTGNLGLYRAMTSPSCFYNTEFGEPEWGCEGPLGFAPNEPSLWQGWASVGVGWDPRGWKPGKEEPDNRLSGPDPGLDRIVFSPTADTLPKGAVAFRTTDLVYAEVAYGLSDNSQLTAFGFSTVILGVTGGSLGGLSFKVRAPTREEDRVRLAWIALAGTGGSGRTGVAFLQTGPVVSWCFDRDCQSVISTHLLAGSVIGIDSNPNSNENILLFGVGGRFRLADHLGFAIEVEKNRIASATLRFVNRSVYIEFGALAAIGQNDSGEKLLLLPIINIGMTRF